MVIEKTLKTNNSFSTSKEPQKEVEKPTQDSSKINEPVESKVQETSKPIQDEGSVEIDDKSTVEQPEITSENSIEPIQTLTDEHKVEEVVQDIEAVEEIKTPSITEKEVESKKEKIDVSSILGSGDASTINYLKQRKNKKRRTNDEDDE